MEQFWQNRYNRRMKSYKFLISGQVQGVWYRRNVQQNAANQRFSGYVKNLPDGRVEAVVTCQETRLTEFIAILREGSPTSLVEDIQEREIDEVFSGAFEVK